MSIKRNVSEIQRLYKERKESSQSARSFLLSKGISPCIAEVVAREYVRKDVESLQTILAYRIRTAGELSRDVRHCLAFIGPTGVGKTTTICKLAEYYLQQRCLVALMTLEGMKKGRLRTWATQKAIPFIEDLSAAPEAEIVLIDTEGCNFYLPNRVEALGERIASLGGGIETILTLSAAAKEVDVYGAIHQFSPLCPSSLCFTKLDETLAAGILVNVCAKTDIPIRYIAYGYPLPGEVQLAEPRHIIHKILTDFNTEEFQYLRQLST